MRYSAIKSIRKDADESSIVAVHGLNGDAHRTWTHTDPSRHDDGICWLSDPNFLPKYVAKARVMTWGYNANITSMKGPTSSNRILQHAQTLVQHLFADRSVSKPKPRDDWEIDLDSDIGDLVAKCDRATHYFPVSFLGRHCRQESE
jgi:hypothetical protein